MDIDQLVLIDPLCLRGIGPVGIQHPQGHLVGPHLLTGGKQLLGRKLLELLGKVQAEAEGETLGLDVMGQIPQAHPHGRVDDGLVLLVVQGRDGQGDQADIDVAPQKPQIVFIEQHSSRLHLHPAERNLHHPQEHPKIGEELLVLLGLTGTSQHDRVAAILLGKIQPPEILLHTQVEVRAARLQQVLIRTFVHPADTEGALVNTVRIGHHNG